MACCLLGLGSNLGDRRQILDRAIARLDQHPQIRVVARSRCYRSPAIGGPADQDVFLNQAARLETTLDVESVHRYLLETENQLGRQRHQRWDARTIDLDLLLYDDLVCSGPRLAVPHPRMIFRRFVLEPAAEVAGHMVHPTCGWTVDQLRRHMAAAPGYVAITGLFGVGKTRLATIAADRLRTSHQLTVSLLQARPSDKLLQAFYQDPAGHAWGTEIEFVRLRRETLGAELSAKTKDWRISDFWFDQSMAYADVWLNESQAASFQPLFETAREDVVLPRLLVLLKAATPMALEMLRKSPRRCEASLPEAWIDRLRSVIEHLVQTRTDQPTLILDAGENEKGIDEVAAAVLAMDTVPEPV
jgi:2-amino-4-hydroxy-6-hydroxymethyldihydropteridine diphosphokinase